MTDKIAAPVEQIVISVVHDYDLETDAVTQDSTFGGDLGMDESDVQEIIMRCEEVFNVCISDNAITEQSRIGDLTKLIAAIFTE